MQSCAICGSVETITRKDGWVAWYTDPDDKTKVICNKCQSAIGGVRSKGVSRGPFSTEHKAKISKTKKGTKRTVESRRKQSASISGEKNHNYGKKADDALLKKLRDGHLGQVPWNKDKHSIQLARRYLREMEELK